ncbi:MAG TPA: hypothetical protein VFV49_09520 [Thermoanaerobaculia bacterium]|nr:hypothetical protein [Thermoanaerobaculia bacterium]
MTIAAHQSALPRMRAVQSLTVERLQWGACLLIIVSYFVSMWAYKIWYIGTAVAVIVTAFAAVIGAVRVRGVLRDLWPLFLYFAYLLAASTQAEYAADARYWAFADSIGFLVACVFWVATRNNDPSAIRIGFVYVSIIAAPVAILLYRSFPEATRLGGYALPFYPISISFLWAEIIGGKRRRVALLALTIVLGILFVSRSRTPLAAGLIVLGFCFLFIGRSLAQRVKLAVVLAMIVTSLVVALMSFDVTRIAVLTFVARVTHEDIVIGEVYIPGEPVDPTRERLDALVAAGIRDVQPFGYGYNTTGYLFERSFGYFTPLHNIYHIWAFEGGVFCALIMAVVLLRHLAALRRARMWASDHEHEILARCLMFSTLGMLLFGIFHQMHQGPLFYAVLGMALGLRQRAVSNHWNTQEVRR